MVKIFVSGQIASEKYLYFSFLSRISLEYTRERLFLRCLAKLNLRRVGFEGKTKGKDYGVGTRMASPSLANKRAPNPSCRIAV
jgi:hypothetical protein